MERFTPKNSAARTIDPDDHRFYSVIIAQFLNFLDTVIIVNDDALHCDPRDEITATQCIFKTPVPHNDDGNCRNDRRYTPESELPLETPTVNQVVRLISQRV